MKKLVFVLLFATSICYGQNKVYKPIKIVQDSKTDSSKSFLLTEATIKTLNDFDTQIKAVQEKQTLYLRGIFEANNFDINKVKDLKFDNGKFIFKTEK